MRKKITEQNCEMQSNEGVPYLRMNVPPVVVDADEPNKRVEIEGDGMHGVLVGKTPIYFIVKDGKLVQLTTSAKLIVIEPCTITDEHLNRIILGLRREASEYGYLEDFANALNQFFNG
jgi:hypothetical protein